MGPVKVLWDRDRVPHGKDMRPVEVLWFIHTVHFFLIATAILLVEVNGLYRIQWKCSHYATATTSLAPFQPIVSKNKSQSQIAQCKRAFMGMDMGYPPPRVWTDWKHYLPHPSDAGVKTRLKWQSNLANLQKTYNSVETWDLIKSSWILRIWLCVWMTFLFCCHFLLHIKTENPSMYPFTLISCATQTNFILIWSSRYQIIWY